jgi:hypothetical protein
MGDSPYAAGARAHRASGAQGDGAAANDAHPMNAVGMPGREPLRGLLVPMDTIFALLQTAIN